MSTREYAEWLQAHTDAQLANLQRRFALKGLSTVHLSFHFVTDVRYAEGDAHTMPRSAQTTTLDTWRTYLAEKLMPAPASLASRFAKGEPRPTAAARVVPRSRPAEPIHSVQAAASKGTMPSPASLASRLRRQS